MKHQTKAVVLSRTLPLLAVMLAPAPMALAQDNFTSGVNISDSDANSAALFVGPNNSASIDGFLCIGFGCTDGHDFGNFDNGILQIVNDTPLIEFEDTSTSGPTRDWTLLVNDLADRERFSIRDDTAGTIPFTVEGGAPENAFWVANDGDIGMGTSLPQAKLHLVSSGQSSIRLDQAGFSWDLRANSSSIAINNAANETPFYISRGAPTGSFNIAPNGNISLGTLMPAAALHVKRSTNTASLLIEDTGASGAQEMFKMANNGGSYFTLDNTASNTTWFFTHENASPNRFIIADAVTDGPEMALSAEGNLTIQGNFIAGSTQLSVPDYVFEPGYELRPLAEVASFIAANRHLPDVPSAVQIGKDGLDMTNMQMVHLKKIEELTLYALEQDKLMTAQHQTNLAQTDIIAGLQSRLDRIEALLER